ncbi:MAG: hypothetical protein UV00_C0032G0004 [candidate division WWE3 bacterium GW2011_GWF1_42_14]|uniref:Uncharacterized protein n=1 Tax=candidate division WWE3 bacterium GW2011_GWF1_42_14 TaxID=1619138 RepID=A0A0G1BDY1_UNCKA|nr:MAG: hypothetical protein UV00_C0032G0004 [candidate division WWE3 bacterium GW2011_GWF1_42_14]
MKKTIIPVLLCIFPLLVFLDFKLVFPIARELIYRTPVSSEQSVTLVQQATATPTPFQPVRNTPLPLLAEPTPTPEPIVEIVVTTPEPLLPENPYDFAGIRFDGADAISIVFYLEDGSSFPVEFTPVIPVNGPDDYKPGIHKAGVFADDLGNVTVNPHSGCYRYSRDWVPLEGEYLRQQLQGSCNDVLDQFSEDRTSAEIEELINSTVLMSQNGISVNLSVLTAGVIKYEDLGLVKSMSPTELSALLGVSLEYRGIVIITSGWDLSHNLIGWFSNERIIVVLK